MRGDESIKAAASAPEMTVERFDSSGGAAVFRIPVQAFPVLWGCVYLVLVDDPQYGPMCVLIDTGSGYGHCNQHLEAGLSAVSTQIGRTIGWDSLTHILITHGHIDHFGGLSYIRPRTSASIGVHELDLRNLTHYEERIAVVARRLNEFLAEAGLQPDQRTRLLEVYSSTKRLYHSVQVDFTFEAQGMRLGPFEMLHVPGHCAGHVVIRLHDLLFSGDHVLNQTSPHQSPEQLTLFTGLGHYLQSLDTLQEWAGPIRLALGGHKSPILDLQVRMQEIREVHRDRLAKVLDLLFQPRTVADLSADLFGELSGYNILLGLEEAGAHVEYLYQRGLLGIHNLDEVQHSDLPIAIHYYRL